MRGKPRCTPSFRTSLGITPAHAGKTRLSKISCRAPWDHPRACGENERCVSGRNSTPGSPPRMRGKQSLLEELKNGHGITPAHAGKTYMSRLKNRQRRDHPRACGENTANSASCIFSMGSPPRMRGKPALLLNPHSSAGITPAHAGKTNDVSITLSTKRDHPRACGENTPDGGNMVVMPGSPPRMRGKQIHENGLVKLAGITPAHAGKTLFAFACFTLRRDHPRACGENHIQPSSPALPLGSPPRMRGKLAGGIYQNRRAGITPAHAGKTLRKGRISVVDPSPQPRSSLTSRRADASIGSQRAPCAAPV